MKKKMRDLMITKIKYLFILPVLMLFMPLSVLAALGVDFQYDPLFSEAEIMPGDSVTRHIKLINSDNFAYRVGTQAIGVDDPDDLASQMQLIISDHDSGVEFFDNKLSEFLQGGIIIFPPMRAGESRQYDYRVYFYGQTGNEYQHKSFYFDIIISSEEDTENTVHIASSGSGGGSGWPTLSPYEEISVKGESGEPYLAINKSISPRYANPGDTGILYKIVVTNNGNFPLFGVSLRDRLPLGLKFSDSPNLEKFWNLGDLEPGDIESVEYLVDVVNTAKPGVYTNIIIASAINYSEVETFASLEVRSVDVKGVYEELEKTGFRIFELLFILFIIGSLLAAAQYLKKKGRSNNSSNIS